MSKRSRRAAAASTGSTGTAAGAGSTGRAGSGPSRTPPSARVSSPTGAPAAGALAPGTRAASPGDAASRRGSHDGGGSYSATGAPRAGRRARPVIAERSFLERNRSQLLIVGGVVAAIVFGGLIFLGSSQATYACSFQLDPATPSPSVAASASPILGQIEDDMGRTHVDPGTEVHYTFCPPASGPHYNAAGQGPIAPRFYGPDDVAKPESWIHNMEHGALVVLYNCNLGGCDQANQDQLRGLVTSLPKSPICNFAPGLLSPVIARFDTMKAPFAALIWGRVMFQTKLDIAQIDQFYEQYAERTNPEQYCTPPSASPGASLLTGNPGAPEATSPPAVAPAPTPSPSGT